MENKLKLFLLTQFINTGYDTYTSAVVVAENTNTAKNTIIGNPDETWAYPEDVIAQYIGIAADYVQPGVIIAAFKEW